MISGQANVLVNQGSKLCELAVRPAASYGVCSLFVVVHDKQLSRSHLLSCIQFVPSQIIQKFKLARSRFCAA
jgi:hypothetical protein